jgi:hypothetical protein
MINGSELGGCSTDDKILRLWIRPYLTVKGAWHFLLFPIVGWLTERPMRVGISEGTMAMWDDPQGGRRVVWNR